MRGRKEIGMKSEWRERLASRERERIKERDWPAERERDI